jgi:hypothetical protein
LAFKFRLTEKPPPTRRATTDDVRVFDIAGLDPFYDNLTPGWRRPRFPVIVVCLLFRQCERIARLESSGALPSTLASVDMPAMSLSARTLPNLSGRFAVDPGRYAILAE